MSVKDVKVNFEIGHEASIRTKRTPEGFTHDWEVCVRGIDAADISQFVDKVVFLLHETFPKPKRVCKEPPYCVKESGYAGFNLPIDIYLKNRDEPKKIRFNYDLHLQQSGPAIIKTQREKYVFPNPSDDFRRKLLKGGGIVVNNSTFSLHSNVDHERNSRDSFTEEKPQQLIGKPKLGGDSSKKHKSKEHRSDDLPRPTNYFVNLFGTPIHKTSRVSPDPTKPSSNPKIDKKEKEKSHPEKDKQKLKHEIKEKDHREEKSKPVKEDKDKSKEEKRSKNHKEREATKEKSSKRPAERPPSPAPPPKKPAPVPTAAPVPPPSPGSKASGSLPKEDGKPAKYPDQDKANKMPPAGKLPENNPAKAEKKSKKEKKSHDKDRESKKEHKKDKELKVAPQEAKPKEVVKEIPPPVKEKEKPVTKPFQKISLENFIKEPTEVTKYSDGSKHKDKGDRERKHKHKKKDKKRDESREKSKDSNSKEKKHKVEKHKEKLLSESKDSANIPEKMDTSAIPREIDKITPAPKIFKEKDRSQLTISPISIDTSSQSSSKSSSKGSKSSKNPLGSMIEALASLLGSQQESDLSGVSDDEDLSLTSESNSRSAKLPIKPELVKTELPKPSAIPEVLKIEKNLPDKSEKGASGSSHKSAKNKDKSTKHETKEEKKQRKRKSGSNVDDSDNTKPKLDEVEHATKSKRPDNSHPPETISRVKSEPSSHVKTDTKVQDDGVSSSLSDHPLKCDSPLSEDPPTECGTMLSLEYLIQLKELQHRIMNIKNNDELERVVNLIAGTGKYEVTKKTFDFDLCLLDPSTVQQLQDLIGSESRA